MSILVIDGHPNPDSLGAALAQRYAAASAATLIAVRDLDFDPVLHRGLTADQPLEDDLQHLRTLIEQAQHLVIITPMWWSSIPAPLKGMIDRVFTKGWAYRYSERGLPQRLLKGRTARVVMTCDSPRWYLLLRGNPVLASLKTGTLAFSGFSPVRATVFPDVRSSTPAQRATWLADLDRAAVRDLRSVGARPDPRTEVVLAR